MDNSTNKNTDRYKLDDVTLSRNDGIQFEDDESQEIDGDDKRGIGTQDASLNCNASSDDMSLVKSSEINDDNQEPYLGMSFDSHDEAYEFYNAYAKRVGFSTRKCGNYRSRIDHSIISHNICCSKEGFRRESGVARFKKEHPVTRDGCKAKIVIKKRFNKWWVTKFEKDHNHDLASPSTVHLLRSHRNPNRPQHRLINTIVTSRMSAVNIMSAFAQSSSGLSNIKFGGSDCQDYTGQRKLGALGVDAHALLDYLKRMQAKNPSFFYAMDIDEDYTLRNVFWVDARCRSTYKHFCDVILFDTTYRKRPYSMPFVSIIGVNHHYQSTLFGCALLLDETESTLTWFFETWLEAMNNQHPKFIIIDQDRVIRSVVTKIFPSSHYRFCSWQILRKLSSKLNNVIHSHPDFYREIENLVKYSDQVEEFEDGWQLLVQKYDLKENDWMNLLYKDRYHWVPVYIKDTCFAGMSTIEQTERVVTLFDGYIHQDITFYQFIEQYEKVLENQYEKEVLADFSTLNSRPILKTPTPMEEQVSKIFTQNVFHLFQEEIIQSLALCTRHIRKEGFNNVYMVKQYGTDYKEYAVTLNIDTTIGHCNCKKFDFEGIVCRHLFAVFKRLDIFELPSQYVLKRWSKDAKKGNGQNRYSIDNLCKGLDQMALRYYSLCKEALRCTEEAGCSKEVFRVAIRGLRDTREKLLVAKHNIALLSIAGNPTEGATAKIDDLVI